jgi:hypothetical protein
MIAVALWWASLSGCAMQPAPRVAAVSFPAEPHQPIMPVMPPAPVYDAFLLDPAQLLNRPRYKSESWDQENLKAHDDGCPTAIYIAPHGVLVQCPPFYGLNTWLTPKDDQ